MSLNYLFNSIRKRRAIAFSLAVADFRLNVLSISIIAQVIIEMHALWLVAIITPREVIIILKY